MLFDFDGDGEPEIHCAAEAAGRPQHPLAALDHELMLSAAASRVPFTLR